MYLQAPWPYQLAELGCTSTIAASTQKPTAADAAVGSAPSASARDSISSTVFDGSTCDFYHPCEVFRGVRARVGIWSGPMDRVLPHGKSGRADYLGLPANRAARMMGAAQGGQVSSKAADMLCSCLPSKYRLALRSAEI